MLGHGASGFEDGARRRHRGRGGEELAIHPSFERRAGAERHFWRAQVAHDAGPRMELDSLGRMDVADDRTVHVHGARVDLGEHDARFTYRYRAGSDERSLDTTLDDDVPPGVQSPGDLTVDGQSEWRVGHGSP